MKWCLSSRQRAEYLNKADEIMVQYRDRNFIYDIPEKYPRATVIINLLTNDDINWDELTTFDTFMRHNFICCVTSLSQALECKKRNFAFYFGFPITSFYELNRVKNLGVCYVRLGGSLAFSLDKVITFEIPVRAVPNIANEWPWPDDDGVCSNWIRPEDVALYENYITTMEFEDCNTQKERALYRIYAEDREWPGDVMQIISNIRTSAVNRLISPEFARTRLNCGQKCQENHRCQYCRRILDIADEDTLRQIKARIDESKENL